MEMVALAKTIDPQKLPPTARSAHYHSLRVQLHVILGKELAVSICSLNPLPWGVEARWFDTTTSQDRPCLLQMPVVAIHVPAASLG